MGDTIITKITFANREFTNLIWGKFADVFLNLMQM